MNLIAMSLGFLALALLGAAGYLLMAGPEKLSGLARQAELENLLVSIPDPEARREVARAATLRGASLEAAHDRWLGGEREALRPLWDLVALRTRAAWVALPFLGTTVLAGVGLGLIRRERARAEFAYSSTTWSYLGKVLFALSTAGYLLTAVVPVGVPFWALYVSIATAALGGGLYFAHIPPKI